MIEWWESLTLLQQIFTCMAVPATLILIIQSILLLFGIGFGGGDGDAGDISSDFDSDIDTDVSMADIGDIDDAVDMIQQPNMTLMQHLILIRIHQAEILMIPAVYHYLLYAVLSPFFLLAAGLVLFYQNIPAVILLYPSHLLPVLLL